MHRTLIIDHVTSLQQCFGVCNLKANYQDPRLIVQTVQFKCIKSQKPISDMG